ncbi:hypothetical protein GmHk_14G040521 [Glycine max]|nr:hypothetical protein GmHk_14G040521 [Glycine max]
MFGHFQPILNKLRSPGRTYDNYDNIDKILRSLSREWRLQVTTLRVAKNLDSMSIEELDEGIKNGKSLALSAQKIQNSSISKEFSSISTSREAFNADTSFGDGSDEEESNKNDQLAFISKKIRKVRRKRECKKPGHFKFECLNLDKTKDKKNYFKEKDKKVLMSTWEDPDDTSSDEETKEEANFCLMPDTTSKESESDSNEEVNLDDSKTLKLAYHELLSNSSILSKVYRNLRKDFKTFPKIRPSLKRLIKISISQLNLIKIEKESQLLLENDKVSKEYDKLMRNFKILEDKIQSLQTKRPFSKFVGSTMNLNKQLRYYKCFSGISEHGYKGNVYVHDEETTICYFCGKTGHMTSKCRNLLKTQSPLL